MKILLAEDDPISRVMTKRMLQSFGYDVVAVEDGRKAADILSDRNGPRLALVDWMMPELDGPALCREVRSRQNDGPYVYMLLLTSRQDSDDIVAGLEAGADDYLTKPCQPAELKARLHTGRRILTLEENLVQAREEMRMRAALDGLTSLWNRTAILARMTAELERSHRKEGVFSVILCDIDHFKAINDTHGHLAGDRVLRDVAQRLVSSVRAYDDVGRYGGEEFLIILSGCEHCDLFSRCEDVRAAVGASPIPYEDNVIPVTISVGAVACEASHEVLTIERVVDRADSALYRAKQAGRNRTVIAESFMAR